MGATPSPTFIRQTFISCQPAAAALSAIFTPRPASIAPVTTLHRVGGDESTMGWRRVGVDDGTSRQRLKMKQNLHTRTELQLHDIPVLHLH